MAPDAPHGPDDGPDAPDDAAPAGAPGPGDELRAKDLLTRPRAELEQALDPATLAELASWFDRPSAIVVEEQARAAAALVTPESEEEREFRAQLEVRQRACDAVDPALVAHIQRHEVLHLTRTPEPPPAVIDEGILLPSVRAQLERQSADEPVPDARPFAVPDDVAAIVARHNAPQAVLRDLFRPVEEYELRLQSPFDEPPVEEPLGEARAAMREHVEIPWIEPVLPELDRARAHARSILREPWADHVAAVLAERQRLREG